MPRSAGEPPVAHDGSTRGPARDDSGGEAATTSPFELVVVTYRSRRQVEELLAGLPADLPVAVVDNSHDEDGIRQVVESRSAGRYVDGGGNGFAKGANLGARTTSFDYVVFVNPDSRPRVDALRALVRDVATDTTIASSAAMPTGSDGRSEVGVGGWEPTVARSVVHALGLHKLAPEAGLFARPEHGSAVRVDWTTGACLAVRVETFWALGGFDEEFYVYNEDMALGRMARERGLQQLLRTDVPVPHSAGGSGAPSREMLRLRGASMARYVGRHHGPAGATTIALALAAGSAARAGIALAQGERSVATGYVEYIKGVLTGRATVAGRPVPAPPATTTR